ncbi:MAG: DUF72 domain-containing protein [Sphingomonadaceae bacterium]|nr:DUF72 domain-containing protein [Sphingomonadaceae bacterium]
MGGWTFEPWRGHFYPAGLPHARELDHASRRVTAIEVNGTFYSTMSPATYAKWRAETPDGFVFALKGPRYAVNRRVLADAGESVARFVASGIDRLDDKLGPILWQLAATKKFDADDIARFLDLLPARVGDRPLRHVLEPRHDSFADARLFDLARDRGVAVAYADSDSYPCFAEQTAGFTYARLQNGANHEPLCYPAAALDGWAEQAREWAKGGRDVFVFFIAGGKVNAPAGAEALLARV